MAARSNNIAALSSECNIGLASNGRKKSSFSAPNSRDGVAPPHEREEEEGEERGGREARHRCLSINNQISTFFPSPPPSTTFNADNFAHFLASSTRGSSRLFSLMKVLEQKGPQPHDILLRLGPFFSYTFMSENSLLDPCVEDAKKVREIVRSYRRGTVYRCCKVCQKGNSWLPQPR